jgi:hypothetical protein
MAGRNSVTRCRVSSSSLTKDSSGPVIDCCITALNPMGKCDTLCYGLPRGSTPTTSATLIKSSRLTSQSESADLEMSILFNRASRSTNNLRQTLDTIQEKSPPHLGEVCYMVMPRYYQTRSDTHSQNHSSHGRKSTLNRVRMGLGMYGLARKVGIT